MKDATIKKIICWLRYGVAVLGWAADSFDSFPRKSEFFKGDGADDHKQSD